MTSRESPFSDKKKVLIVDDNANLLLILRLTLKIAGYEVEVARNGIEGLQKFQTGTWDLVITDRDMPEMDGEQMTERIKTLAPLTPVILVTGFPSHVAQPGLFRGVFSKPYTGREICHAVGNIFRHEPHLSLDGERASA